MNAFKKGNELRGEGKYQEAIQQYVFAMNINDTFHHWIYFNRSVAYEKVEKYDEALSDINKAIEIDSSDPNFRNRRGNVYFAMGDYLKAIDNYNEAIEIDSQFGHAYLGRSRANKALENNVEAAKDFERAEELRVLNN